MNKKQTKLIHVGEYVAKIEIELIVTEDEWSPYHSIANAANAVFDATSTRLRRIPFTPQRVYAAMRF